MNISQKELNELRKIEDLAQQKIIEINALKNFSQALVRGMFEKHGCDKNKQWEVSLDDGEIREVKKTKQEEVKDAIIKRKNKKNKK